MLRKFAMAGTAAWLMAASAGAQSAPAGPFHGGWGVMADMAPGDYYVLTRGYPFSALRIEWVRPGEVLRLVDMQQYLLRDCTLARTETPGLLKGECASGTSTLNVQAEVKPDGSFQVAQISKDWLVGEQKFKWGPYRYGKTPGSFEWKADYISTYKLARVGDPAVKDFPKMTEWMERAFAQVGHVGPATPVTGQGSGKAMAPSPVNVSRPAPSDKPPL